MLHPVGQWFQLGEPRTMVLAWSVSRPMSAFHLLSVVMIVACSLFAFNSVTLCVDGAVDFCFCTHGWASASGPMSLISAPKALPKIHFFFSWGLVHVCHHVALWAYFRPMESQKSNSLSSFHPISVLFTPHSEPPAALPTWLEFVLGICFSRSLAFEDLNKVEDKQ